jgi:hypothetical protein
LRTTLSFHAERLEDEAVWSRVRKVLDVIGSRGGRATLFVEPLSARLKGFDLEARLEWVASGGHEIALHTHFYQLLGPPGATTGFRKGAQPIDEDVTRCLDEGLAYLDCRGFRPRGFVSGAWAIAPRAFNWLAEHDFVYDCSFRTFPLKYPNPGAQAGDDASSPSRIGDVLELPTTGSAAVALGASVLPWADAPRVTGPAPYRHVYLHDYDLMRPRWWAALHAYVRMPATRGLITAMELAEDVSAAMR